MASKKGKKNMVWVDMEMSGLNPDKEVILEIATVITDSQLNILEEGPSLVLKQPEKILKGMDAWNRRQHKKSGLVDAVRASKVKLRAAETKTLNFIKKYCFAGKAPLCGNSIHHDRRFLIRYMPRVNKYLHYRHVDVTTVKDLAQRWMPSRARKAPKKGENHRALDDIRESIQELRWYRENVFRK